MTTTEQPTCPDCTTPLPLRTIYIHSWTCWKCSAKIRIATGAKDGIDLIPDYFTESELDFAKEQSVLLERRYSFTAHGSYLANLCPNCNEMQGNFYLYTADLSPHDQDAESTCQHGPCDHCAEKTCERHGTYYDLRSTGVCPLCHFERGRPPCQQSPDTDCPTPDDCRISCTKTNPFQPLPDQDK